jgi:hypothetical protein
MLGGKNSPTFFILKQEKGFTGWMPPRMDSAPNTNLSDNTGVGDMAEYVLLTSIEEENGDYKIELS